MRLSTLEEAHNSRCPARGGRRPGPVDEEVWLRTPVQQEVRHALRLQASPLAVARRRGAPQALRTPCVLRVSPACARERPRHRQSEGPSPPRGSNEHTSSVPSLHSSLRCAPARHNTRSRCRRINIFLKRQHEHPQARHKLTRPLLTLGQWQAGLRSERAVSLRAATEPPIRAVGTENTPETARRNASTNGCCTNDPQNDLCKVRRGKTLLRSNSLWQLVVPFPNHQAAPARKRSALLTGHAGPERRQLTVATLTPPRDLHQRGAPQAPPRVDLISSPRPDARDQSRPQLGALQRPIAPPPTPAQTVVPTSPSRRVGIFGAPPPA